MKKALLVDEDVVAYSGYTDEKCIRPDNSQNHHTLVRCILNYQNDTAGDPACPKVWTGF